jgi:predicted DNA-binding protein
MEFKKREKKAILTFRLPLSINSKLLILCKKEKITKAYAIEQLVRDYFEREPVGMGAAAE